MTARTHFAMRSYQLRPYLALQSGCKRFVERIHRRAGKDRNWLNIEFIESQKRVGNYVHVFPTLNQGRHDVWDNTFHDHIDGREIPVKLYDPTGQFKSIFPREFVRSHSEQEMQLHLINGSIFQIMGADDERAIARLRGQNGVAYVLSEFAFMHPGVWRTLEPVLLENGGWAVFISTPNSEDDEFDIMCKHAASAAGWFFHSLSIEDTRRDAEGEDGSPVVSKEQLEDVRKRENTREEEIQREYYVNTKGYRHGTIYGDLINIAERDGRILRIPYTVNAPVGTCFDLGHSDAMAVWFYQRHEQKTLFIDYWEDVQKDMKDVVRVMRELKPYMYGRVCLPWDGRAAADYLEAVNFRNVVVQQKRPADVQVEIEQVRRAFSTFYFESEHCAVGLTHLKKYAREFDRESRTFSNKPKHDEHSHAADALRTGVANGFDPIAFVQGVNYDIKVEMDFDPRIPSMGNVR